MTRNVWLFAAIIALLFEEGIFAERILAAQTETRASHLGPLVIGMYKEMNHRELLDRYPGSRTSILSYVKLDIDAAKGDARSTVRQLKYEANDHERMKRDFWPQIALETQRLSLPTLRQELENSGSQVDDNLRTLARAIAQYRDKHKWFFIRPFSEMNDEEGSWEFANKQYTNTPQDFAAVWKLLRDIFDEEGATNAIFIFSPLAAYHTHHEMEILKTLNLIPAGYIDAFGLNVYSRPLSAYGRGSAAPISFAELATPWIKLLASSKHHGIPLAVPEMGVSQEASDVNRSQWLRQAFVFARNHDFVMLTYFNVPGGVGWTVEDGSLAEETLREAMASTAPDGIIAKISTPLPPAAPRKAAVKIPQTPLPANSVRVSICPNTHLIATQFCPVSVPKIFPRGKQPTRKCSKHSQEGS